MKGKNSPNKPKTGYHFETLASGQVIEVPNEENVLDGPWGYAIRDFDAGCVWIPAVDAVHGWRLNTVLNAIWAKWHCGKMVFSAVMHPASFKKHLRNVKREWREYSEAHRDYSYCIEIEYEPRGGM